MRTLPQSTLQELFAPESGEDYITLLTLTIPGVGTVRLSDMWTSYDAATETYRTVSRSQVYGTLPMRFADPTDKAHEAPRGRIVIDNVSRQIIANLRVATGEIAVTMEKVLTSAPDTVDILFPGLIIDAIDYDAETISADIAFDLLAREMFPQHVMGPSSFKGLF